MTDLPEDHMLDEGGDPTSPARPVAVDLELPPDRWRWPRRLLMTVALGAAVAFCVVTIRRSPESASNGSAPTDPAVVRQEPEPGAHILRQASVGVELKPGYDGRITVSGVTIPEDQMDGATPPGSPAYDPRYGVRPNNRQHVFYTPGPDKAVPRYPTGEVHVSVRFWPIAQGPDAAKTISWAFFVN